MTSKMLASRLPIQQTDQGWYQRNVLHINICLNIHSPDMYRAGCHTLAWSLIASGAQLSQGEVQPRPLQPSCHNLLAD